MSNPIKRRKRGVLKNGRNKGTEPFVMLWRHVLVCDAYRSMKALPRAVYTELRRRFNGRNNGELLCSIRDLVKEIHCSKDAAANALRELQEKGFIKCAQRGSFHFKVPHAPKWILTEESYKDELPTKEFLRWRAPEEKPGTKRRTRSPETGTASESKDRDGACTVPKEGPIS